MVYIVLVYYILVIEYPELPVARDPRAGAPRKPIYMVKMINTAESTSSGRREIARRDIVHYGRKLGKSGFHAALAGNISARIGEDRLMCTSAGCDKRDLQDDDLVVCDLGGKLIEGSARPTSELLMHLTIYRKRPDVCAVIHAHPPTATAFAAASEPLNTLHLPEMLVWLGPRRSRALWHAGEHPISVRSCNCTSQITTVFCWKTMAR